MTVRIPVDEVEQVLVDSFTCESCGRKFWPYCNTNTQGSFIIPKNCPYRDCRCTTWSIPRSKLPLNQATKKLIEKKITQLESKLENYEGKYKKGRIVAKNVRKTNGKYIIKPEIL